MTQNLLALAVKPLDVATPLLQARRIQQAETETQQAQFNLRQAALGSAARGLMPYVSPDGSVTPEFRQRWGETVDGLARDGHMDPQQAAQIRNTPSTLVLQQLLAQTSSMDQYVKMQELHQSRGASENFNRTLAGFGGAPQPGGPQPGAPSASVLPRQPSPDDPTMSPAPSQVAAVNGLPAPARPTPAPQQYSDVTFGDGVTVPNAPPSSSFQQPGQQGAAPTGEPARRTVNPAVGRLQMLVGALSQRGLPKQQFDLGLEMYKAEVKNTEMTPEERQYYNSYVPQQLAAGQKPEDFTAWFRKNQESRAGRVNVNNNVLPGERKFDETMGAAAAKRWDGYIEEAQNASRRILDLRQMRSIGPQIDSPGAQAAVKEWLGPYASAIGINIADLPAIQAYSSIIQRNAPQQRVAGSGSTSDIEYKGMLRSMPGLMLDPRAREIILDTMEAVEMDTMARGEIASRLSTQEITRVQAERELRALPEPMKGFMDWRKQNPEIYNNALRQAPAKPSSVVPQELRTRSVQEQLNAAPVGSVAVIDGQRKQKQQDGSWKLLDGK